MKTTIYNFANLLSLLRILATPFLIYMIFNSPLAPTIIVFCLIALTDAGDGYIARKFNQGSYFGKIFDPIADRIFFISTIVTLAIRFSVDLYLFVPLLTREMIAMPGNIILLSKHKPLMPPVKFIGKLTTTLQCITLPLVLLGWKLAMFFVALTSIAGIVSGIHYVKTAIES